MTHKSRPETNPGGEVGMGDRWNISSFMVTVHLINNFCVSLRNSEHSWNSSPRSLSYHEPIDSTYTTREAEVARRSWQKPKEEPGTPEQVLWLYTGWAGESSSDGTEPWCKDNQVTHVGWWTLPRPRFSPKRDWRLLTCLLARPFCCCTEDSLLKTWEDTLGATAVTMKEGDSRD